MSATLPDLTPEAELLDAARTLGCRYDGPRAGIPGRLAPRLCWTLSALRLPSGAPSFSTSVDATPAALAAEVSTLLAAFAA